MSGSMREGMIMSIYGRFEKFPIFCIIVSAFQVVYGRTDRDSPAQVGAKSGQGGEVGQAIKRQIDLGGGTTIAELFDGGEEVCRATLSRLPD